MIQAIVYALLSGFCFNVALPIMFVILKIMGIA